MSDIAIHADNLGKKYRLGQTVGAYRTFRDSLQDWMTGASRRLQGDNPGEIWALNDDENMFLLMFIRGRFGELLAAMGLAKAHS